MDESVETSAVNDKQTEEDVEDEVLPEGDSGANEDMYVDASDHPEATKYKDA